VDWEVWKIDTAAEKASVVMTGTKGAAVAYATSMNNARGYRYQALPAGGSPFDVFSDEALAAENAAVGALHARQLAAQMTDWLTGHDAGQDPLTGVPADVVEWCRAARDHLAQDGEL
jgi:hypothetical protein